MKNKRKNLAQIRERIQALFMKNKQVANKHYFLEQHEFDGGKVVMENNQPCEI